MFDIAYHRQTSISGSPLRIRSHATLLVTSLPPAYHSHCSLFSNPVLHSFIPYHKNNSQGSRLLSDRQPPR
jgi:hypothetical protein